MSIAAIAASRARAIEDLRAGVVGGGWDQRWRARLRAGDRHPTRRHLPATHRGAGSRVPCSGRCAHPAPGPSDRRSPLARAKRTDRTEARRRTRAEQAAVTSEAAALATAGATSAGSTAGCQGRSAGTAGPTQHHGRVPRLVPAGALRRRPAGAAAAPHPLVVLGPGARDHRDDDRLHLRVAGPHGGHAAGHDVGRGQPRVPDVRVPAARPGRLGVHRRLRREARLVADRPDPRRALGRLLRDRPPVGRPRRSPRRAPASTSRRSPSRASSSRRSAPRCSPRPRPGIAGSSTSRTRTGASAGPSRPSRSRAAATSSGTASATDRRRRRA